MELEEGPAVPRPIKLVNGIDVSELQSKNQAFFEIDQDNSFEDDDDDTSSNKAAINSNVFLDEKFINSFRLGLGNADDEVIVTDNDMEPFELMSLNMEDLTDDRGVLKKICTQGYGPDIPPSATVTFHYSAYLEYGDEPFDSTFIRNRPQKARLNHGDVIRGLDIALLSMRKNENARFLVKPDYAFGKMGCPPRIPPYATLLYEVKVVDFADTSVADDFEAAEENLNQLGFREKMELAKSFNTKGRIQFNSKNFSKAKYEYRKGTWVLECCVRKDDQEEDECSALLLQLYNNLAQVYLELKEPSEVCRVLRRAKHSVNLGRQDSDALVKYNYRLGKAYMMLNEFKEAHRHLSHARQNKPNNQNIIDAQDELNRKESKYAMEEKLLCRRMFQSFPEEVRSQNSPARAASTGLPEKAICTESYLENAPASPAGSDTPSHSDEPKTIQQQLDDFASDPQQTLIRFPLELTEEEKRMVRTRADDSGWNFMLVYRPDLKCMEITKK